jgi:hypothetical protein
MYDFGSVRSKEIHTLFLLPLLHRRQNRGPQQLGIRRDGQSSDHPRPRFPIPLKILIDGRDDFLLISLGLFLGNLGRLRFNSLDPLRKLRPSHRRNVPLIIRILRPQSRRKSQLFERKGHRLDLS